MWTFDVCYHPTSSSFVPRGIASAGITVAASEQALVADVAHTQHERSLDGEGEIFDCRSAGPFTRHSCQPLCTAVVPWSTAELQWQQILRSPPSDVTFSSTTCDAASSARHRERRVAGRPCDVLDHRGRVCVCVRAERHDHVAAVQHVVSDDADSSVQAALYSAWQQDTSSSGTSAWAAWVPAHRAR